MSIFWQVFLQGLQKYEFIYFVFSTNFEHLKKICSGFEHKKVDSLKLRKSLCQIRFHNSGSSWRKSPLFTTFSKKSKAGREEEAGSGDLHTSALQRVALEPLCPHFAESSRCCSSQFFSAIIALYSVQFWQPNQAHMRIQQQFYTASGQRLLLSKWPKKSFLLSLQLTWTEIRQDRGD